MSSRTNVTTPGGFFVGLGGIVLFCVVSTFVYWWVKAPASSSDLRPQQVALGLRAAADADKVKVEGQTSALLSAASQRYNGGKRIDLDKLDDLRGVLRYRESEKSKAEAAAALAVPVAWKGDKAKGEVTMPIGLAMKVIADGLKDRKPKASAVKLDVLPPLNPNAPPMMPNRMGGGVNTVIFADPNAQPAAATPAPAPAAPPPGITPAPSAPPATAPSVLPPAPIPAPAPATPPPAAAPAPAPAAPPATTPSASPPTPVPKPVEPAKPAEPVKPAAPPAGGAVSAKTAANVALPNRPPLLNWPDLKK